MHLLFPTRRLIWSLTCSRLAWLGLVLPPPCLAWSCSCAPRLVVVDFASDLKKFLARQTATRVSFRPRAFAALTPACLPTAGRNHVDVELFDSERPDTGETALIRLA